jgi:hypothetical protein
MRSVALHGLVLEEDEVNIKARFTDVRHVILPAEERFLQVGFSFHNVSKLKIARLQPTIAHVYFLC